MESSIHTCRHWNGQPSTVNGPLGRTPNEGEIRKQAHGLEALFSLVQTFLTGEAFSIKWNLASIPIFTIYSHQVCLIKHAKKS